MQGDSLGSGRVPSSSLPAGVTVMTIRPMYSPGQIRGVTFLGGPLAGGWLLALNYQRLRLTSQARLSVGVSLLATAILIAIGSAVPARSMSFLTIASVIAMSSVAKALQGDIFQRHVALQGRVASHWRVIGIGLASLAIAMGAVFGVMLA